MAKEWIPTDYMVRAVEWGLSHQNAGLMLDPGLRKTSITLAIASTRFSQGLLKRVLVVAPLKVCQTVWPAECEKWADFDHFSVCDLTELSENDRSFYLSKGYDIYCINPESAHKIFERKDFEDLGFGMLVLDESTKWKDTQTKRFKALKKVRHVFTYCIILTGTPIPNGVQDLFGQIYVLDGGERLGKYITHFRMQYMFQPPNNMYVWEMQPGKDEAVYAKVEDVLLRMKNTRYIDMPEKINNFIEVELPAAARKQYKELDDDFITFIEENPIVTPNAVAKGGKLRQMANGFVYYDDPESAVRRTIPVHDEKLDALEILVESMQGRPLLVAYEFIADAERLQARFPTGVNIGDGNLVNVVRAFNAGRIPLLFAHPQSAGHGLNLQEACNTVCWFGITWNLEFYEQLIARVWRSGQAASQVIVHHIVAKQTRDQKVMRALEQKAKTQEDFNLFLAEPIE